MNCKNCGFMNNEKNNFCVKCGSSLKPKKDNYVRIAVIIVVTFLTLATLVVTLFLLFFKKVILDTFTPHFQEMHSSEELLSTLDNLDCSTIYNYYIREEATQTKDDSKSCKLKDKYIVLNEEIVADENHNDARKIDLKLKDYDVEFSIQSAKMCTSEFSATCIKTEYVMITDYRDKATEYFYNQYSAENSNSVCNGSSADEDCSIKKEEDIEEVVKYIFGYIQYLNNLDLRFLPKYNLMSIEYPAKVYSSGGVYRTYVYPRLENGKYNVYILENGDYRLVDEGGLKDYLLKCAHEQEVF